MPTKGAVRIRVMAATITLALLLQPFASASAQQQPVPNQTASGQSDVAQPVPSHERDATNNSGPSTEAAPPDSAQPSIEQLPDSPGAVQSRPAQTDSQPAPAPQPQPQQEQPPQPQQQQQPRTPVREPVGTAAAESVSTSGVAASRPAGAALAPAKQRRIRSILIKVGALAGVGVAVGATMALSQASPSKPPGAH
jgi:cytoskeletal protein RodZ